MAYRYKKKKKVEPTERYTLQYLLEYSVVANDFNLKHGFGLDGYAKESITVYHNDRIEDYPYTFDGDQYQFSNRDLVKEAIGIGTMNLYHKDQNNIPGLVVTDAHRKLAHEIYKHLTTLTFKALAGTLDNGKENGYEKTLLRLVTSKDSIHPKDIATVSSIPAYYIRAIKQETSDERKSRIAVNSEFFGDTKARFNFDIEVLSIFYLKNMGCYVLQAVSDGNLILTYTSRSPAEFGSKCNVRGTVKRHQVSSFHGGKETVFNRVQVEKIHET